MKRKHVNFVTGQTSGGGGSHRSGSSSTGVSSGRPRNGGTSGKSIPRIFCFRAFDKTGLQQCFKNLWNNPLLRFRIAEEKKLTKIRMKVFKKFGSKINKR